MNYRHLFSQVCQKPGMYVCPSCFSNVCSFIYGFDTARDSAPLMGFREWLVLRNKKGDNLGRPGLAMIELGIEPYGPTAEDRSESIAALGRLLEEFFTHRETNGLHAVYSAYHLWLSKQSWTKQPSKKRPKKLVPAAWVHKKGAKVRRATGQ